MCALYVSQNLYIQYKSMVYVLGVHSNIQPYKSCSSVLDEGDSRARLVDLPDVEPLVLVQALIKLVWRVSLGQDALTSIGKLHRVWVRHFSDDTVDSIDGSHSPAMQHKYRMKLVSQTE